MTSLPDRETLRAQAEEALTDWADDRAITVESGYPPPRDSREEQLARALLVLLDQENAADRYWRAVLADTAIGLRAQNVSVEQAAGAIERLLQDHDSPRRRLPAGFWPQQDRNDQGDPA